MYSIATFFILLTAWVILSGQFDLFHLSLGLISCLFVTWFSSDLLFHDRTRGPASRLRELVRFPVYAGWLFYEIMVANVHVLYLALHPKGMDFVDPQVVRFRTQLKSDFAKYILANSITLTPGTVTVKIDGDEFYVHAISRKTAMSLEGEMEDRIAWATGEKKDR